MDSSSVRSLESWERPASASGQSRTSRRPARSISSGQEPSIRSQQSYTSVRPLTQAQAARAQHTPSLRSVKTSSSSVHTSSTSTYVPEERPPTVLPRRMSQRSESYYPEDEKDLIPGQPYEDTVEHATAEPMWSEQSSGGERTMLVTNRRGIVTKTGIEEGFDLAMGAIIQYKFKNPDLLEEALESQGSGKVVVGKSHRLCLDGNTGLGLVGEAVMKLVLKDQCYLFNTPKDDWQKTIEKIISWEKLARIGRNTVGEADKETKATNKKLGVRAGTIEGLIRPKAPLPHSQRKNLFALIKDDIQNVGHDQNRQIARAIKAIIGAVYFDGGFEAARRVMAVLRLTIQGTEKKS